MVNLLFQHQIQMLCKFLDILKRVQLIVQILLVLSESVENKTMLKILVVPPCILIFEMLV